MIHVSQMVALNICHVIRRTFSKLASEVLFLVVFAIKRNAVDVFVNVHDREAQFGLLRIADVSWRI